MWLLDLPYRRYFRSNLFDLSGTRPSNMQLVKLELSNTSLNRCTFSNFILAVFICPTSNGFYPIPGVLYCSNSYYICIDFVTHVQVLFNDHNPILYFYIAFKIIMFMLCKYRLALETPSLIRLPRQDRPVYRTNNSLVPSFF